MTCTLGLDIGGANLKAVIGPIAGHEFDVRSIPFVLWRQPQRLVDELRGLCTGWPRAERIALTMTAELCDCFATKRDGVHHVLQAVQSWAGPSPVSVWLTTGRFASVHQARHATLQAAASNWHALATRVARLFPQSTSLLVDIGSTTSDIVALRDGKVDAKGLTDMQRLATGELLYLGAKRTPLVALGPSIEFRGQTYDLMAEWFASTADVYVLTGQLPEDPGCTDAPDGQPMTVHNAARRVVRMIGGDLDMLDHADAVALAAAFAKRHRQRIAHAMSRVLAGEIPHRVIAAGSGSFIMNGLAADQGAAMTSLADHVGDAASNAACAWAVWSMLHQTT